MLCMHVTRCTYSHVPTCLIKEEDERNIRTAIDTDEMLALTLQQEVRIMYLYRRCLDCLSMQEMDSGLVQDSQLSEPGGAASLIKKELDERLTEDQRRLKQVQYLVVVVLFMHT